MVQHRPASRPMPAVGNPRDGGAHPATAHQQWTTPDMVEQILLQHTSSGQPQTWWSTYCYSTPTVDNPRDGAAHTTTSTPAVDNLRDGGAHPTTALQLWTTPEMVGSFYHSIASVDNPMDGGPYPTTAHQQCETTPWKSPQVFVSLSRRPDPDSRSSEQTRGRRTDSHLR